MEAEANEQLIDKLRSEVARLKEENQKLKDSNRRWMRIAGTDSVTGLPNKLLLTTALMPQLLGQVNAEGHYLACIILAPDGLGAINQQFGRDGGDQIVADVASFLKEMVEGEEKLIHLDGANFVLVMPQADMGRARRRSRSLRARIVSRRFEIGEEIVPISLSMGLVVRAASPGEEALDTNRVVETFLVKLGAALDEAKHQGGDRAIEDPDSRF